MTSRWRRFEVLFPLRFNNGRAVPRKWLLEAVLEIVERFGAVSQETQHIEGHWRHAGIVYRDKLVRIIIDLPDLAKNRQWIRQFKARWKTRLKQLDLWVVSYRIEIE